MLNILNNLAWEKMGGLLPAIVQHSHTKQILMLGYMNKEALELTLATRKITFYSRSKARIWVKGESSGNYLTLENIVPDCDHDAIFVSATPMGPTCHQGTTSCFTDVISRLENTISQRIQSRPEGSYISGLLKAGLPKMAQKVGEEGVEVAIASLLPDRRALCEESADLLFHLLVLLQAKEINFSEVLAVLAQRAVAAPSLASV
jgi:phosphoribosyl-ATP pyrophosphohydrolase/phosphoribosyl-AMP cyclohydrolase